MELIDNRHKTDHSVYKGLRVYDVFPDPDVEQDDNSSNVDNIKPHQISLDPDNSIFLIRKRRKILTFTRTKSEADKLMYILAKSALSEYIKESTLSRGWLERNRNYTEISVICRDHLFFGVYNEPWFLDIFTIEEIPGTITTEIDQ